MVAYRSSQGGLGALPPELHTSTVPVVVGASPLPSVPFIPQRHPPFPLLCLPFVHCLAVCLGRSEATHSQRDVGSSRVSFVSLFLLSLFSFPPLGSSFISVCCKPNWDKIHVELGQNSRRIYGTTLDYVSHLCDGQKKRPETVVGQRLRPHHKPT